ncbi:MAG: hypothetical protein IT331_24615 [Anaerolineae bacterium]|nr:hypothetical protein [Anaerolineae bacterium]
MKKQEIELEEQEAEHGEKMVEIKVRFWTSNLAEGKDAIFPKYARANGVVRMQPNKAHNIVPKSPKPFNSLMELPSVIEKVLIDHGITLYESPKMRKYLTSVKPHKTKPKHK